MEKTHKCKFCTQISCRCSDYIHTQCEFCDNKGCTCHLNSHIHNIHPCKNCKKYACEKHLSRIDNLCSQCSNCCLLCSGTVASLYTTVLLRLYYSK